MVLKLGHFGKYIRKPLEVLKGGAEKDGNYQGL